MNHLCRFIARAFRVWLGGFVAFLAALIFSGLTGCRRAPAIDQNQQATRESLEAEISQTGATLSQFETKLHRETDWVAAEYKSLQARRNALKPGDDAATAAFNRDAAVYQAHTAQLRRDEGDAAACQTKMSELLDRREKMMPDVIVYSTSWCHYCKLAKEHLEAKGVRYREVDVEKDPDGAAALRSLGGGGGVPVIVIKGKVIHGYNEAAIDALL